jgi:hypothetical protein
MEKYLTTEDTSRRLKSHGVDQLRTKFYWVKLPDETDYRIAYGKFPDAVDTVAAFTASEIADLLKGFGDWITYSSESITVRFMTRDGGMIDAKDLTNEAEGRGIILAGLLDQGIIKLKGKIELL